MLKFQKSQLLIDSLFCSHFFNDLWKISHFIFIHQHILRCRKAYFTFKAKIWSNPEIKYNISTIRSRENCLYWTHKVARIDCYCDCYVIFIRFFRIYSMATNLTWINGYYTHICKHKHSTHSQSEQLKQLSLIYTTHSILP